MIVMRPLSVSTPSASDCSSDSDLRDDEHAVPIPAIDVDAGDRRQEERRDLAEEADEPEQERRIGEAVDEPARGNARDPRADERHALAGEEEPVVTTAKRAEECAEATVADVTAIFDRIVYARKGGTSLPRPSRSVSSTSFDRSCAFATLASFDPTTVLYAQPDVVPQLPHL